ncbi:MAG TPA: SURF1 family protein [Ilumatobacter sp.]|nr:SURF1 family protein [Ilumatobacter sp.]
MYRFLLRPKWIGFHLLVVVGIVTMVNLGFWQLRRLDQRRDSNATIEARYDAPPLALDALVDPRLTDPQHRTFDAVEWRPVDAHGTYLDDASILIVNRSQGGRAGENVVTPLSLPDGRILLVNRGFVPLTGDVPEAPRGSVTVTGRLHTTERRRTGQLSDPAVGALELAQRVDIDRLAAQFDAPLVPMYIDLIESVPPEAGPFPEQVQQPDLSEGSHLSYAVQWFVFSSAVAVGWVLAVRHSVSARRAPSRATRDASPAPMPN